MAENYYPIEFSETGQFTIINNGTAPAPCVITFIPRVDFNRVIISGLTEEPIEVENIQQDQVLVINGEDRIVTLDNENYLHNYNCWEFPKLQPGVNEVQINNAALASLAIEYSLRYI